MRVINKKEKGRAPNDPSPTSKLNIHFMEKFSKKNKILFFSFSQIYYED